MLNNNTAHDQTTRLDKHETDRTKYKKQKKIIKIISFSVLSLILLLTGTQIFLVYQAYQKSLENISNEQLPDAAVVEDIKIQPFNFLLIGLGTNGNDAQNSLADSINLVSINPQNNYAEIIAVPRDAYLPFGASCEWGAKYYDKITHSTATDAGGAACLQSTLEEVFDIPINYYVSINFVGFVKIVDSLGGVEMNVPDLREGFENYPGDPSDGMRLNPDLKDGTQWCEHDSMRNPFAVCFNKFGMQTVTGEQALALARSRHYDSDLGRSMRQTELIKAILAKGSSASTILSASSLIEAAGDTIETNIPSNQFLSFADLGKQLADKNPTNNFTIRTTQLATVGDCFTGHRITTPGVCYGTVPIKSVEDIRYKLAAALSDGAPILTAQDLFFSTTPDTEILSYTNSETLFNGDDVTDPSIVRKYRTT